MRDEVANNAAKRRYALFCCSCISGLNLATEAAKTMFMFAAGAADIENTLTRFIVYTLALPLSVSLCCLQHVAAKT
jgi:hypothetical protein